MNFQDVNKKLLDGNPNMRAETVRELAESGDGQALPFVYGALEDRTPQVRHAANKALMTLRFGVGVLSAMERAVSNDPIERRSAVTLLRDHPDSRAIERLERIATDEEEELDIREIAIEALQSCNSTESVPLLLELLDNETSEIRAAAIGALRTMPIEAEPDATGTVPEILRIAQYLQSDIDPPEAHARAATALGACEWPSALNYLAEALQDPRPAVRLAAANAVVERRKARKHDGVVTALRQLLKSEKNTDVRDAVSRVVQSFELD